MGKFSGFFEELLVDDLPEGLGGVGGRFVVDS